MEGALDLTDDDIFSLLEVIKSREKKNIAKCVLSIKCLLIEVQQQLLLLMDNRNQLEKEVSSSKVEVPNSVDTSDTESPATNLLVG